MAFEFKLPDIGEGVVEGEIVQWLVKPGDAVAEDQPMVEVMTDKATVVISSPTAGVVKEVRGGEGDMVEVHSIIAIIDDGSASEAEAESPTPPAQSAPSSGQAEDASSAPAAPAREAPRVLAAPATRRLARELGVDLTAVKGTGPGGRVTSDDVRGAQRPPETVSTPAPAPASPPVPTPAPSSGEDQVRPVRGLRRRIWENMARSTSTAAHFTFVEECDATELVQLRKRFNDQLQGEEPKLSFLPFIVKAVVVALREFPDLNGQLDEQAMTFTQRAQHDIGIAVSSDQGLTVPVVRGAGGRSLLDLSAEIKRLADAVREGRVAPTDLGGSSFTITSLGKDGGLFATPVINHPEVAIMGVHRMRREPRVMENDELRIRDVFNFSLSFDHRWIDGHVGAAFTYRVIRLLQRPDRLFMEG